MALEHQVGLIFGKFYPLHCGHLYLIEKAMSQVNELHIMLGCEATRDKKIFDKSHFSRQPQVSDRYLWLQQTFKNRHNIHIHILDEAGIAYYPDGWKDWSDKVKSILAEHHIKPTKIFTSEMQDVKNYETYFDCSVNIIDAKRDFIPISATEIRQNPYKNWSFIAKAAQPFFIKKVAIIGNSQLKELPEQLANIYNTKYVVNGYINYIEQEIASKHHHRHLSDSDFVRIAMLHAERINQAVTCANKLIFTTIDFDTLVDYYREIFQTDNEILNALKQNYHFDLVINQKDFNAENTALENFELASKMVESLLI